MKKRKLSRLVGDWQPYDYGYNLEIEREMFKKQADYFAKSEIAVNDERRSEICKLLVKLLDIVTGRDYRWHIVENTTHFEKIDNTKLYQMVGSTKFADDVYINTKNANRFLNSLSVQFIIKSDTKHELREAKAWYLYNKLRFYKMRELWN